MTHCVSLSIDYRQQAKSHHTKLVKPDCQMIGYIPPYHSQVFFRTALAVYSRWAICLSNIVPEDFYCHIEKYMVSERLSIEIQ